MGLFAFLHSLLQPCPAPALPAHSHCVVGLHLSAAVAAPIAIRTGCDSRWEEKKMNTCHAHVYRLGLVNLSWDPKRHCSWDTQCFVPLHSSLPCSPGKEKKIFNWKSSLEMRWLQLPSCLRNLPHPIQSLCRHQARGTWDKHGLCAPTHQAVSLALLWTQSKGPHRVLNYCKRVWEPTQAELNCGPGRGQVVPHLVAQKQECSADTGR